MYIAFALYYYLILNLINMSPNSTLVQRTINLNYANKKRSNSIKWIILNAILLLVFVYDLSCKCPGYTSLLHYIELGCAVVFAANLVQYATYLIPTRCTPISLSREQQKLLGLSDVDLDSSFVLSNGTRSKSKANESGIDNWSVSDVDLSLSPRTWGSASSSPNSATPPSMNSTTPPRMYGSSPASTPHRDSSRYFDTSQDCFISDSRSLSAYLERWTERAEAEAALEAPVTWVTPPPAPYRLSAAAPADKPEESSPQTASEAWSRLDLDPQRLTQWNLNLRLWIHVTILERLVRELSSADETLARLALCEAGALKAGRVPLARVRAAAAAGAPQLRALLPFLEPYPDQTYLVRRITELSAGGCMSAYKWDGGGAGWEPALPTDAELVLHLFATYLDSQMASVGAARPFSAEHVRGVGEAGGAGARGRDDLAVVRVRARPPQYALAAGGATLAVGGGRNNLLHALLLFLAAAARRDPPAVRRLHLGPAGLNMLWIIGR